jgi:hypothetical protein
MRIYEVIGVKLGYQHVAVYAARNENEVKLLAGMIQDQGGLPMVHEIEVPDNFDQFALDLPSKALADPCMN